MKILICTPVYQEKCHVKFAQGVSQLQLYLHQKGIPCQWATVSATYVQVGRDILVNTFLKSDATHLFFIDSDIFFNPEDAMKLIEADKDICAGLYPVKDIYWKGLKAVAPHVSPEMLEHIQAKNIVFCANEEDQAEIKNPQLPVEVKGAATGFMLIKREVFEKYKEAYHDTQRYEWYDEGLITRFFKVDFLPPEFNDPKHYGEDIWFCQMIRALGVKIYAIPAINLGHMGEHTYFGCSWCCQGKVIHPK